MDKKTVCAMLNTLMNYSQENECETPVYNVITENRHFTNIPAGNIHVEDGFISALNPDTWEMAVIPFEKILYVTV